MRCLLAVAFLPACLLIRPITVRDPVVSLASIPATVGFEPLVISGEISDENAVFAGTIMLSVDGAAVAEQEVEGLNTPVALSWTAPPNERDVIHIVSIRVTGVGGDIIYDESVNVIAQTALTIACPTTTINRTSTCTSSHPVSWKLAGGGSLNSMGHLTPTSLGQLNVTATSIVRSDIVASTTTNSVAPPPLPVIASPSIVTAGKPGYNASTPTVENIAYTWSAQNLTLLANEGAVIAFTPASSAATASLVVTATNAAGDSESADASIAIVDPPLVPTISAPATTTINRPITATALSAPGLTYQWGTTGGTITGGATTSTLAVTAPAVEATITLNVVATNAAGDQANAQAQIAVEAARVDTVLGTASMSGDDDGAGAAARFDQPRALAFTPDGILWVVDNNNNAVRRVDVQNGYNVTTVAGLTLNEPEGIAYHRSTGLLYIADTGAHVVRWLDPLNTANHGVLAGAVGMMGSTADGTTGAAARFTSPAEIADGGPNTLYLAEYGGNAVHRISLTAPYIVSTVIPSGACSGSMNGTGGPGGTARIACPFALAYRDDGLLFVGQSGSARFIIDTTEATLDTYALTSAHSGRFAQHAALDRRGNIYLTANGDNTQHWVERWTYSAASFAAHDAAGGVVANALGNGTTALAGPVSLSGAFGSPHGIALDPISGDLFVSSLTYHIIVRLRQP